MSQEEHDDPLTDNVVLFPRPKTKTEKPDLKLESPESLEGYLDILRNHLDILEYVRVLEALVSQPSYTRAEPAIRQLADYALLVSYVEQSLSTP